MVYETWKARHQTMDIWWMRPGFAADVQKASRRNGVSLDLFPFVSCQPKNSSEDLLLFSCRSKTSKSFRRRGTSRKLCLSQKGSLELLPKNELCFTNQPQTASSCSCYWELLLSHCKISRTVGTKFCTTTNLFLFPQSINHR